MHRGGKGSRETQVCLESMVYQGTTDPEALWVFLVVQVLKEQRVKKDQVVTQDLVDEREEQDLLAHQARRVRSKNTSLEVLC